MNTTSIGLGGPDKLRSTIRLATTSGVRVAGSPGLRSHAPTRVRRAVTALGAVTLFGFVGLHPLTAEAVTCQPAQRGTLGSSNTFTQGTTDSHNDYRISCTGDTSGQGVTAGDLAASFDHENADAVGDRDGRLVVHLTNAFLDLDVPKFPIDDRHEGGIVVLGTEGGASEWNEGIRIGVYEALEGEDLDLESHATISTIHGAQGIVVWVDDDTHRYAQVRVRNFGSVETMGGGSSDGNRRGDAVTAGSRGGTVEVVNESGATVVARGPAGRGVMANTNGGLATATNRGTVTTHGDPFNRRPAHGVSAYTNLDASTRTGGVARATNEAGGTVTTHGRRARGVHASAGDGGIAAVAAIATNRGTVTTHGDAESNNGAYGVYAYSDGGTARAANDADATIRTYGTKAYGLSASNNSFTGRAEAENRGSITTSGPPDGNDGAGGIVVSSDQNTATAVNHEGATVTTSGAGAPGIDVYTGYGSADEIAMARNRGTVTTTGNGFYYEGSVRRADGVAANSGGEASAVAENGYTGVIETSGTGAAGVQVSTFRGGGASTTRNRGRITTRGNPYRVDLAGTDNDTYRIAFGMGSYSENSDATVVNEAGGVIETHGTATNGMDASANGGGVATAVNRGRVTTRGGAASDLPGRVGETVGARGIGARSSHSNARVVNDATGRVDTHGEQAFALIASTRGDGSRTSVMAEVVNRGQVRTGGQGAHAVLAHARRGSSENPNHVRASNTTGASITTAGAGATGLAGWIRVTGGAATDAHGTAAARNDGTILTGEEITGQVKAAGGSASNGVVAGFYAGSGTTIANAGDVTVINTGDVTVKRENATGLYAETFGSGTATVQMMGGSVRAEGENGRGVWARTGTTGEVHAIIAGGAQVIASGTGGIAAEFNGGTANVRLLDSRLDGKVVFGAGTDTFTVRDGRVTGAIDFGAGADSLSAHGDTWLDGALSNLETLAKRGSGNLVVGGDASFSSGASAVVENGGLVFTGQFDLGTTGTMRIHDAARLTAVLVDTDTPPQITAGGGITFDGDEELFVQVAPGISATDESTYLGGFDESGTSGTNPIANGTTVTGRNGQVALRTARGPSTVVDVGHIPLLNGATNTTGTSVQSEVRLGVFSVDAPADHTEVTVAQETPDVPAWSPSAGGLVLGGGVSALGSALFDVFDAAMLSFAQDEARESERLPMPGYFGVRTRDGGREYLRSWAGGAPVLAGGTEVRVHGVEVGVDRLIGRALRLGVSLAPEITVSDAGTRLDGGRYAVRGAWRGELFHAGASVSQGRYRAQTVMDNPVAGGGLGGAFDLAQDHVQLGAGARLAWSGVQVAPSLSVLAGALRQEAHTAEGAAFRAEVPAFSQRYQGWKSEVAVTPRQWLRGPRSVRWRPALNLYTQHVQSTGPASLEVAQHDKAGVLSLTSRAQVSGLPRTVHGFTATVDALHRDEWRIQLGIAGAQTGGEYDQAVYARMHMRF